MKRARDDRGKRATQREAALSGKHEILNPVLEHADDFSWQRAPKLRPAENKELSQALGYSGDPESEWFRNMMTEARRGKQPEYWSPQQREFTDQVLDLLRKHPQIDDIDHPGQWGFDNQNKLKLLDYGEELAPEAQAMFAEDYPYLKRAVAPEPAASYPKQGMPAEKTWADLPEGDPGRAAAQTRALDNAKQRLAQMAPDTRLGQGHARIVHDDGTHALKLARREAGLLQNRSEADLSGKSPYLNPVIDHAPDYSWVRQGKLKSFGLGDEPELAKHMGLPPENENWLRDMVDGKMPQPPTPQAEEFYNRIQQVMKDVPELDKRDLGKASQWGLDAQGRPLLLDYGFTKLMPLSVAGLGAAAAAQQEK